MTYQIIWVITKAMTGGKFITLHVYTKKKRINENKWAKHSYEEQLNINEEWEK